MNSRDFIGIVGVIIFCFIISLTIVQAQPVTEVPVTTAVSTPVISPSPSLTNPKNSKNRNANKKRTKQQVINNVSAKSNGMLTGANAALSRLDSIWIRVKSRIEKFRAAGKDVSGLDGWIQQAEFKRIAASDAIASASATAKQIPTPIFTKNKAKNFVANFNIIKTALKDYHKAILTVITNIKGMSRNTGIGPSVIPSATTAPTATPSGSLTPNPTNIPATISLTVAPT